jgi:hypothetical protein
LGGVGFAPANKSAVKISAPQNLNEALDVIRYVASKRSGTTMIIIDEMERVESESERDKFAEFIKSLPEIQQDVRFLFCGIAQDVTELLQSHPSAGRILETIKLERLHHSELVVEIRHLVPCFRLWTRNMPELAMCATVPKGIASRGKVRKASGA